MCLILYPTQLKIRSDDWELATLRLASSAGTSSSIPSSHGSSCSPALHGSKRKRSARCAVPPNSTGARQRVRRNSSPPGAEREAPGRGSERALALFLCSSALRTSFRKRYTPAQQEEAIHAPKSHRNRRVFQRELRQSRRECRCRSRQDRAA